MPSTRRDFLKSSLLLMAAESALSLVSPRSLLAQAAKEGAAPGNRRLILVQLIGGNDGLNTLIPYRDDQYQKSRPKLGVPTQTVLPLEGTDFALHPALPSLRDLYHTGRLAIIQGVGYPNPNRSHFESTDVWESADPTLENRTFGWAGRLLDQIHDQQGGLTQGIAVEEIDVLPLSMAALRTPVQTIKDPLKFGLQFRERFAGEKSALLEAYRSLYSTTPEEHEESRFTRQIGLETYKGTSAIAEAVRNYEAKATYPAESRIGQQLQSIAKLLIGGSSAQVYHTSQNGYDHHSDQLLRHGPLLSELNDSLTAFYQDLQAYGLHETVTIMVYTEFGRRVFENGSAGTDHGVGGLTFILGGSVRGGLYGHYPSLTDLDEGDLKYNVDFRSIYATLIHNWMGSEPEPLLGGTFPLLDFLGGSTAPSQSSARRRAVPKTFRAGSPY